MMNNGKLLQGLGKNAVGMKIHGFDVDGADKWGISLRYGDTMTFASMIDGVWDLGEGGTFPDDNYHGLINWLNTAAE
jgi:hypothetical protein